MTRSQSPKRKHTNPKCPICYDRIPPDEVLRLDCHATHRFHKNCIVEWLLSTGTPSCPFCRTKVDVDKYISSLSRLERLRVYFYVFVRLLFGGFGFVLTFYRSTLLFRNLPLGTVFAHTAIWGMLQWLFMKYTLLSWLFVYKDAGPTVIRLFATATLFSKMEAGWFFDFTFVTLGRIVEQLLFTEFIVKISHRIAEHWVPNKVESGYMKRMYENLSRSFKIAYYATMLCFGVVWMYYLPVISDWAFDVSVEKLGPLLQVLINRNWCKSNIIQKF